MVCYDIITYIMDITIRMIVQDLRSYKRKEWTQCFDVWKRRTEKSADLP